ncbi:MBOAT family protein [Agarivorans sp. OAG1]|uniref:MBOAT family O-acyltransferase n=1 Tax=unclassified Agarivorans TaxID=2636026 RepID=UPI0030CFFDE7
MLFNSYAFVFLFLPIVCLVYFWIGNRGHHRVAVSWLVGASLFFYGWWNPAYLGLIMGSMLFNYAIGVQLNHRASGHSNRKLILVFGITLNLALLAYYKYANFFVDNFNLVISGNIHLESIVLPLAISFFTFQQVAYLIDAYREETREYNFLQYCLFVTFFPQLIAGPIVHHKEMMPQFLDDSCYQYNPKKVATGLCLFILGLAKKVLIADELSVYVSQVFTAAEQGVVLAPIEAWYGALSYTFQLYFDFSGYADMAIGVALLFGISLPFNFNSPYKSLNIIEFWRRWHITLSRFLRDYVYIPLGGNRLGSFRRYQNLLITMLLGGLWHGAGWTFIIWGGMHGVMLVVNHQWHQLTRFKANYYLPRQVSIGISWLITFTCVVFAWVVFRAESLEVAMQIWKSMLGFSPFYDSSGSLFYNDLFRKHFSVTKWILGLTFAVLVLPNSLQIVGLLPGADKVRFRANFVWAVLISILALHVILNMNNVSEFLYFRF